MLITLKGKQKKNSDLENSWRPIFFLFLTQGYRIYDVRTTIQRTDQRSDQTCS